jgi:hypothetical protein
MMTTASPAPKRVGALVAGRACLRDLARVPFNFGVG